jgi:hypothetical protein
MKQVFLVLTFIIISQGASAQLFSKEKIKNNENFDMPLLSWGYYLGLNSYDFNFDYERDLNDIQLLRSIG